MSAESSSREYPNRPFVGVGAVVVDSGRILMIKRGKPPRMGDWSLPGGAQKLGEVVDETARREVGEETGLEVEILGLIDVVDSIRKDDDGAVQFHYTLVDVLARPYGGELRAGGDAMDARWFARAELDGMKLWSETYRIIDLAIEMEAALAAGA